MTIRLKIASIWLPDFILKRELDKVARKTIKGLDEVLKQHASPQKLDEDVVLRGSLEGRRSKMTRTHNSQVRTLINELGYEKGIELGRKAMFSVGYGLGQDASRRLGVGDNFQDLEMAAKILYKVLGIDFKIENKNGNVIMIVNRCSLSRYYTADACKVLSAADEGVVRGLNENMEMKFKERITEGASECIACFNEVKV